MNLEKLNRIVKHSGLSKRDIADAGNVTRQTLDNVLAGSVDLKVSTLEGIASALNIRVGDLFDEPPAVSQTGAQNNINGDNVSAADPSPLWEQLREKDAQIRALLDIIGKFSASLPASGEGR